MNQEATTKAPGAPGALERLRGWGQRLAAAVRSGYAPAGPRGELEALLAEARTARGGERAARARAEKISALYRGAGPEARAAILGHIARAFMPERAALDEAVAAMRAAGDDVARGHAEARLRIALDAPRARFFAQFNLLAEGVKFLVDLRADLLAFLEHEPALDVLRVELDGLLETWFDPGFLELRRITWQSPAFLLEKLIAYEAVHRIESWDDLKNRLDRDRRCYAFFHPRMPNEPLIFVEIALAKGLPGSVQVLLDEQAPISDVRKADTAVFYSISNAQKGLRGISLGNLLLKRVIAALQRDLPWLQVFCTLSPIPGLRRWLERAAPELARDGAPDAALREPLLKACARYLVQEKKDGLPLDPVAQFHLHNGASVDRIFWAADASARGMQQSLGMMVSYRYALADVDRNHEEFLSSGHVAAARRVLRLL
ncbi:MAG: malonyl-CoA decarboxylase [Betaproteobacteria bacterium]|nr:malonyl-CoA decarboxylase [Betaproteobacteria bacterium]